MSAAHRLRFVLWCFFFAPFAASAQDQAPDPRWGVLAELAERDFQVDGVWLGDRMLHSFRWEDPGRKISWTSAFAAGVGVTEFTLDPRSGQIVGLPANGEAYLRKHPEARSRVEIRLTVGRDGSLQDDRAVFFSRFSDGKYKFRGEVLVEALPGGAAMQKAGKLIAAGKLRTAEAARRNFRAPDPAIAAQADIPPIEPQSPTRPTAQTANPATADSSRTTSIAPPNPGADLAGQKTASVASGAHAEAPLPAGSTQLPEDFKIRWMRGLVLVDDPNGAKVVKGNETSEAGSLITHVNNVPVSGVGDLISKVDAADPKTTEITSTRASRTSTPFFYDVWAENLRYQDTPHGVVIVGGFYDVGKYLRKINDVEIKKAADVRPILLDIVNGTTPYRGRTYSDPLPEERESVAALLAAETARLRERPAELDQWGTFALLPGKLWYCVGYEPSEWIQRKADQSRVTSLPVDWFTKAGWSEDHRSMTITSMLGDTKIVDVVTLRPDGTFAMSSSGVTGYANLIGRKNDKGEILFPLGRSRILGSTDTQHLAFAHVDGAPYFELTSIGTYRSVISSCTLEQYDELKAPRLARHLAEYRKQEAGRMEGQRLDREFREQLDAQQAQMNAEGRAAAFAEFAKIPQVMAQVNQQRAELDRLRQMADMENAQKSAQQSAMPSGAPDAAGSLAGNSGGLPGAAAQTTGSTSGSASTPVAPVETYKETGWFTGVSIVSEADAWADAFAQCEKAGVTCWKGKNPTLEPGYFYVDAIYYTGRTLNRGKASTVTGQ